MFLSLENGENFLLDLLPSLLCEYSLWIRWYNKNLFMHSQESQCVVDAANTIPFSDRNFLLLCHE